MKKLTEKQRAKRKHILDAAISCFIEKGFHATSTAEICKAAGMSPGNLFHYYPTKSAIIEAIAEEDSQDYDKILSDCSDESSPIATIEKIEKIMAALLYLSNEPGYARLSIEIIAEASRNPNIYKIFTENDKKVRERLVSLIRQGIETGEIDKQINAEQAVSWIMATVDGTIGRKGMGSDYEWVENLDFLTCMIRKTFAP
ncbi:TetR/AcrR family transcriptional regulator [Xenorhabdus sp. Reich]|uniref:TetR/AcrR family transcriptional regulator n=1 Tax=Xenorhabdus littoralis TaxID=2582835 RepID=A0ABU4SPV5_9GAMM|nr:TetR/AcrR family transcriptional regulator [Xenorhabdus sp. Reich]MDX8000686.1 TetR/AcrR family transcriptional regulator [Xenorhabdus sp. Reich]